MHIHISIQRPVLLGCLLLAGIGIIVHSSQSALTMAESGGELEGSVLAQAVQDIDRERVRQAVLEHQEEILRYQLSSLEEEALKLRSPDAIADLGRHREVLLQLIKERRQSEQLFRQSLEQLWEAQGTTFDRDPGRPSYLLNWPVAPSYGISAHFEDPAYEQRFHFAHHAIDIPVEQGTPVAAPADGTAIVVRDNGLGYSYVTLEHEGDVRTTYGHVSSILVEEGERIRSGQVIALSGGRPGSKGAGLLTTGPHLHFAVRVSGQLVDPMKYLRKYVQE